MPSVEQDYTILHLPSKGECYENKQSDVAVRYLTASDENYIFSDKLRRNGTMCDILLERTILMDRDKVKTFVSDLCATDREYILLWLRRSSYGNNYSSFDKNGNKSVIDLSKIMFTDFSLKGDEEGYFNFTTGSGDIVRYRLLTHKDEVIISEEINELKQSVKDGGDMTVEEYAMRLCKIFFNHYVVSVNGNTEFSEWLDGLNYEECKEILQRLKEGSPSSDAEKQYGLELNEALFSDIINNEKNRLKI